MSCFRGIVIFTVLHLYGGEDSEEVSRHIEIARTGEIAIAVKCRT